MRGKFIVYSMVGYIIPQNLALTALISLSENCINCITYVDVIVLKRSCPAVSQICNLHFSPPISIVLILKSTPIVVIYVPEKIINIIIILSMVCTFINKHIQYGPIYLCSRYTKQAYDTLHLLKYEEQVTGTCTQCFLSVDYVVVHFRCN